MQLRTQPAPGHISFLYHRDEWVHARTEERAREAAQALLACSVEVGSGDYHERLLILRYHRVARI